MAELGQWIRKGNVDDRRDEPWPWHELGAKLKDPQQSVGIKPAMEADRSLEPVSPLAMQLGAMQVAHPTPEEMMRFLTEIEMMNPYEPKKRK